MDVLRGQRKINYRNFLQHYLHSRMAASSGVILAGLLCVTDVVAEPRVWVSGSAYVPKVATELPTPVYGLVDDKTTWVQSGEVSDASGKTITVEIKDSSGKLVTGAISVEQFNQLKSYTGDTEVLRIDQKSNRLILNWENFDIGAKGEVKFVQPSTTSLALNKINDSASPSVILGKLAANGGIYLINHNGIVFGQDSQVNVGSLVASSLDVDDDLFINKSLSKAMTDENTAAFTIKNEDGSITKTKGDVFKVDYEYDEKGNKANSTPTLNTYKAQDNSADLRGDIAILDGAKINTTTLNGVVAVAPNVVNQGEITTPDGQTILAAAQDEAFVLFSNDPSLRGLLIEVNTGGDVTNLGNIIAERGNVTLAGIAVNHSGTIKATTSVDFNGTVRLLARDKLASSDNPIKKIEQVSALLDPLSTATVIVGSNTSKYRIATRGGDVTLGESSIIDVAPELDSEKAAPDAQAQGKSGVEIAGNNIHLQKNASITAKGGRVFLEATSNLSDAFDDRGNYLYKLPPAIVKEPNALVEPKQTTPSRIVLEQGSKIDVSGVEVDLPMERNVIEVELRGNELADSPLQRGGFLNGKKVLVDVRKGTPLADITAASASVPKQVGERLTEGGSIQLRSAGEVIVQPNTTLDVSGGGIHYAAGFVATTNFISEGKVINIADADPKRIYSGILGKETATNKRFNITETFNNFFQGSDRGEFVNAFDQGDSAGSVTLQTQAANFHGAILAGTFTGPDQRQLASRPSGGSFNLEVNLQNLGISQYDAAAAFDLEKQLLTVIDSYKGATENPNGLFAKDTLELSQDLFNKSGVARYNMTARNGSITLTDKADLHLADGASLNLFAADYLDMNGRIHTTGGTVSLATGPNRGISLPTSLDLNRPIKMGETATIDTSGAWYNENPLLVGNDKQPISQLWIDAGAVSLKAAGDLLLDVESAIIANGGGWINRLGSFLAGKGGNITLSGKLIDSTQGTKEIKAAQVRIDGTLTSYAFTQGGELNVTAPTIVISDEAVSENSFSSATLLLDSRFFQRGGFSSFSLTAQGSNEWISEFSFAEFIDIKPRALNYSRGVASVDLNNHSALMVLPTGSQLLANYGVAELPDYERNPVSLGFDLADKSDFSLHSNVDVEGLETGVRQNNFVVPVGVRINADPKAKVSFTASTSLVFDGVINARGGNVSLTTNGNQSVQPLDLANFDDVGIWLGKNSFIDVSSTFIKNLPGADGLTAVGKVVNAGTVSFVASRGFVLAEQGSILDVSAAAYPVEHFVTSEGLGAHIETQMLAAKAGTITLKAAEGILFDGELRATGAGYGALGGTLIVELDTSKRGVPVGTDGVGEHYDFSNISFADRRVVLTQSAADKDDERLIPEDLSFTDLGGKDTISSKLIEAEATFYIHKLVTAGFDSYLFTPGFTEQADASQRRSILENNPDYLASSGVGSILFEGDTALVAGRSIDLNATTIGATGGRGLVVAPYIKVGSGSGAVSIVAAKDEQKTGDVTAGSGELVLAATNLNAVTNNPGQSLQEISNSLIGQETTAILLALNNPAADGLLSLKGNIATQGADNVTLASAGDIRTTGVLVGDGKGDNARYLGSFAAYKNLTLQADQIYPTTLSEFIFSSGENNFSSGGDDIDLGTEIGKFKLVDEIQFAVTFSLTDGTVLADEIRPATLYEAYDVLAGKMGVGDSIFRLEEAAGNTIVKETITAVINAKSVSNPDGKITILAGGKTSAVMSAAGSLIFDAPAIEHGGAVKAPFGRIVFNTQGENGKVVMSEGSLTSVSAENATIPFGELDASGALIYNPAPNVTDSNGNSIYGVRLFNQSPEAKVVVNSANIDLQNNATIDLSGGGDLLAHRFVPGPGGSKDILAAANSGETFVIMPSFSSHYAAYDPSITLESSVAKVHTGKGIGEKVYLSGTGDLPAGEYTILPARYALLPGAYLVTPVVDGQTYAAGQQVRRLDGTPIVAGRFISANTGEYASQLSGFAVEPGAIARTRSEYVVTTASELFNTTDTPKNNPDNAASLVLLAGDTLNLEAKVIANVGGEVGAMGDGAQLEIVSNNLLITDKTVADSTAVQVLTSQLAGFDSILFGGRLTNNSDGSTSITAQAQQVEVAKNTVLTAPNILLVARATAGQSPDELNPDEPTIDGQKGKVILAAGAQIRANGTYQQQAGEITFYGDALLSVSSGKQLKITQQSTTLGDLVLAKGSSVQATKGSVMLLSNAETQLNGEILMQGGALEVGAGRVSLGQVNESVLGLKFTNEALAKLNVDQLQLTSGSSLDLYGAVNLGFSDLTLQASSLRGFHGNGTAVLDNNSASLTVKNSLQLLGNTAELPVDINTLGPGLASGNLTITADKLVLGKGNLAIGGFADITLAATTAVVGDGAGKLRAFGSKNFTLTSPLITGMGASNTQLVADGLIAIQASGTVSDATLKSYSGLGSRWSISGEALAFSGNVILPSGQLSLDASGTQGESLSFGAGAAVDVSGHALVFDDTSLASNGGSINLASVSGDVILDSNSRINISGIAGAKGSDAGKLSIKALAGQVALEGTTSAVSGTNSKGGSLDLAVQKLTDFSKLVKQVAAGNFTEAFGLRVSSGDIHLNNNEQLSAHNLSLTTDNGSITIAGTMNASGVAGGPGGKINLNASKDLNLQSTAQLLATSTVATKGGDVFLGTSGGFINIASGAKVDVTGGGTVTLRAPRTEGGLVITGNQVGNDVAINLEGATYLPAVIVGAAKVDVNAFKIYDIISATSEIFNTDTAGNSTLSDATGIVSYRAPVPFGVLCGNDFGCGNLIKPDSDNNTLVMYPVVSVGQPLPVGSICGDLNGCSYSYKVNNTAATIANRETKTFMAHAEHMEARLFGAAELNLTDEYHVKPELELRTTGNLIVDEAIDFGEDLGVTQIAEDGSLYVGNDQDVDIGYDSIGSLWRFNDKLLAKDDPLNESVYDPMLDAYETFNRYTGGEAGVLSLRAGGDIAVFAPVSDGFVKTASQAQYYADFNSLGFRTALSDETKGWNYHWVAGADLTSANAMATTKAGEFTIADDVVLRTSTGNISLAAGGNMLMGNNAALYTAGHATGRGVYDDLARITAFDAFDYLIMANANYASGGGEIDIQVGNNLEALGTPQYLNDWLQRAGGKLADSIAGNFPNGGYLPTTWSVVYEDFKQGIATLGGGDIRINTGGNVNNLSVSLPTTAKNTSAYTKDPLTDAYLLAATTNESLLIQGGGALHVDAGGDILSGQFFVARGSAKITAAGDITAANGHSSLVLAAADSQIAVAAGGAVSVASIFNPTIAGLSAKQTGTNIFLGEFPQLFDYQSNFFTYGAESSAMFTALSGDIHFATEGVNLTNTAPFVNTSNVAGIDINVYPAQLQARALQGDIEFKNRSINLFPSTQGNLTLLAANNISAAKGVYINVPDTASELLPDVLNPVTGVSVKAFQVVNLTPADTDDVTDIRFITHALTPLYIDNPEPMRVITQTGDIKNIRLVTPTHTLVSAGRDIKDVTFEFQNVRESDVSSVKAGRDIVFETSRNQLDNSLQIKNIQQGIDISGFGRLDLMAGRNIILGASRGVQSTGALRNPNLLKNGFGEESGAAINLLAGLKTTPDYAGFSDNYLGDFAALTGIDTTGQLINFALNLDVNKRANAERFIKSVSSVTHRDYFAGLKLQNLSDAEVGTYVAVARSDFENLAMIKQQQIAFRVANERGDNYTGDLIELVTSASFGGTRLDSATLLTLPLQEQHALAVAAFTSAPVEAQRGLILQTYFAEVKQGGIQDASGSIADKTKDGFVRSSAAIAALFPDQDATEADPRYQGDISLIFSTIQTQQGGDVNLLAPGGGIDVGAAAIGGGVKKDPSKLGLIALRNGSVNATVNDNINVNASRVFALDGGDILLWASKGNIDAGRGAKTALSVPPPVINDDGSVNFQAAVAGSGIRNSRFTQDRSPGAVYLFAPTGVVNAGDAGIGSQGDVLIAAQQVIGADNIDVGGVSIGIPISTGVSAGVASAGASTASAAESVGKDSLGGEVSEALDQKPAAFVTIDILGFDF
ncbi:MAG: filamentous hemagglutinin family protein [Pseudomonadota bacterium]